MRADVGLPVPLMRTRRWAFLGAVAASALAGLAMMLDIVRAHGITPLEVVILALFAPTFGWIATAFWNAVVGFVLQLLGLDPLTLRRPPAPRRGPPRGAGDAAAAGAPRTALVMPVHNEDPDRVMDRLAAMVRSLGRTGQGDRFDVHLLSDTTDPAVAVAEEEAWSALRSRLGHPAGMHYRRRPANVGRKAGNIGEFCERWGGHYEFMVVLDADSVMSGETLVRLVAAMEADPGAGLIQTVPLPARQSTLFGRLVQFAGCLYGPLLATGQSFWQGDAANYWGHNAIVRVRPFAEHCRLPVLPGRPPLGGSVLSHDFVEAALLRRAGWGVWLLPALGGSWEEVPGNVPDYARRDRRWSQGSLQHLRLLALPRLHPLSRLHFVLGAMGYVSSLLWLLMLVASTAYIVLPDFGSRISSADRPLLTDGPLLPGVSGSVSLLAVTAAVLFAPKLLALLLALGRARAFGGPVRLLASALLEMAFAVAIAPLMMLHHTRFVASVLAGRSVGWDAQPREGRAVPWSQAWRSARWPTALGLGWAALTLAHSPAFFLWLSPILAGLLLSAPLVRWTSSRALGEGARRLGLFLAPPETARPAELERAPAAARGSGAREPALDAAD